MLHDPLAQGIGRAIEQHDIDAAPGCWREVGELHGDANSQIAVESRALRGVGAVADRGAVGHYGDVEIAVGAPLAPGVRTVEEQGRDSGDVLDSVADLALEILHEWEPSTALLLASLGSKPIPDPREPRR